MITEKIDKFTYKVELYDWDKRHDDYIAGYLRRDNEDEDSDRFYWRFYPCDGLAPICAGDLSKISKFIRQMNLRLGS